MSSDESRGDFHGLSGVERNVAIDLADRQRLGIQKYGVSVSENPLTLKQWLQHAYEECLDQAVYLKRAIMDDRFVIDSGSVPSESESPAMRWRDAVSTDFPKYYGFKARFSSNGITWVEGFLKGFTDSCMYCWLNVTGSTWSYCQLWLPEGE